jgi:hypothetical protein
MRSGLWSCDLPWPSDQNPNHAADAAVCHEIKALGVRQNRNRGGRRAVFTRPEKQQGVAPQASLALANMHTALASRHHGWASLQRLNWPRRQPRTPADTPQATTPASCPQRTPTHIRSCTVSVPAHQLTRAGTDRLPRSNANRDKKSSLVKGNRDRGRPPQVAGEPRLHNKADMCEGKRAHPPLRQANTFPLLATPTTPRMCLSSSGFMHGAARTRAAG